MPIQSKQQPPYYDTTQITKNYTALLSQTGTNPPTAIQIINSIGNIILTRDTDGFYLLTKTGAFLENNTWAIIITNQVDPTITMQIERQDDNTITIQTNEAGIPTDGWLDNTPIQIITKS